MFRPNLVKTKLAKGEKSFGIWLQSGEPLFAEIVAHVGFDFFIIDNEHGCGSLQSAIGQMRAASAGTSTAIVRIPSPDPVYLKRVLDSGAEGVLIPMVETAEQARICVEACRYPPLGKRGNSTGVLRADNYGLVEDYIARAHESLLVIPQIETVEGVRNARAIAEVDGVDIVFIGPTDLSGSAGLPNQTGHPAVEVLIAEAVAAARAAGKPVATVPRQGKPWQAVLDDGFDMVATGSEVYYFRLAAAQQMADWRAYCEAKRPSDVGASRSTAAGSA